MATTTKDALVMIGVSYIRPEITGTADLRERLKKAMKEAKEFWMTTDEDVRFKAAVVATILESTPEERDLIERSMMVVSALAAAMAGVPVDIEAAMPGDGSDLLPLVGMWRETE